MFDFSNYSTDLKFFDQANKKIIVETKGESEGKIKVKCIKWEHIKSRKYHFHVLMIKDFF